jgi:hypothetical protein
MKSGQWKSTKSDCGVIEFWYAMYEMICDKENCPSKRMYEHDPAVLRWLQVRGCWDINTV